MADVKDKLVTLESMKALHDYNKGTYALISDLENYYKKSETYSKDEINQLISLIPKFTVTIVSSLPTNNISTTTIYLVKNNSSEETENYYIEYLNINGTAEGWEIIGTTDINNINLDNYYNKDETEELVNESIYGAVNVMLAEIVGEVE